MEIAKSLAIQLLPALESLIESIIDRWDCDQYEAKKYLTDVLSIKDEDDILVQIALERIRVYKELGKKESVSS